MPVNRWPPSTVFSAGGRMFVAGFVGLEIRNFHHHRGWSRPCWSRSPQRWRRGPWKPSLASRLRKALLALEASFTALLDLVRTRNLSDHVEDSCSGNDSGAVPPALRVELDQLVFNQLFAPTVERRPAPGEQRQPLAMPEGPSLMRVLNSS